MQSALSQREKFEESEKMTQVVGAFIQETQEQRRKQTSELFSHLDWMMDGPEVEIPMWIDRKYGKDPARFLSHLSAQTSIPMSKLLDRKTNVPAWTAVVNLALQELVPNPVLD